MIAKPLWVIEMLCGKVWEPTMGIEFARSEGRWTLARWRTNNPNRKFRLQPYAPRSK